MKTLKLVLLAASLGMLALPAAKAADIDETVVVEETPQDYANMGWYLRGDIGWSFLEWDGGRDDDALAVGGGVGYRFNDFLRTDVRVDWAGDYNIGSHVDGSITTVLGNAYLDWTNDSAFTPYVGAGAGYGWADSNAGDDDGFAFALMGGVAVDLSENIALDVGYRYRDVTISGPDPSEHQILGGIRFGF